MWTSTHFLLDILDRIRSFFCNFCIAFRMSDSRLIAGNGRLVLIHRGVCFAHSANKPSQDNLIQYTTEFRKTSRNTSSKTSQWSAKLSSPQPSFSVVRLNANSFFAIRDSQLIIANVQIRRSTAQKHIANTWKTPNSKSNWVEDEVFYNSTSDKQETRTYRLA